VKSLVLGYDGARNASTMPDGLKYEDWRKSKDRESDGQKSGTSKQAGGFGNAEGQQSQI
jgi:hypothetical protein